MELQKWPVMNQSDFVAEFEDEDFPSTLGRWVSVDDHDPQFTAGQLNAMEAAGLIDFDRLNDRYRMTLKAAAVRARENAK